MLRNTRLGAVLAITGLAIAGTAAAPAPAQAWWRGGWCCGVGIGVFVPPIVVAPPVYAPPPAYYPPPVASSATAGVDPTALARRLLGARPLGLTVSVSRRMR